MYKHLFVLPNGTQISSGRDHDVAIQSVTITEGVNSQQELAIGSVCSKMIDATIIADSGALSLAAGDAVTVYRVDEEDGMHLVGTFYMEEPTRTTAHKLKIVGFDAVSKLDKDLTEWLAGLTEWPYTVEQLAKLVCEECGLSLIEEEWLNADFWIFQFTAKAATGRHLMQWINQITGTFCRATPEGNIEFAWYAPNNHTFISPSGENNSIYYFQNQLSFSDYQVHPIEKVQIRQSSEDVGTVFPNEEGEKNTYIIENNPMLPAQSVETLTGVAETLYRHLSTVTYTPFKVQIPSTIMISPGDILKIVDANGKEISVYVMKKTSNGKQDVLEGTGSYRRNSTTVVNTLSYQALSGKVLNLRTDVDGIKAENKDTQGKMAAFSLDLESIQTSVSNQASDLSGLRQSITELRQTAEGVSIQVQKILDDGTDKIKTGTGYTFDDTGMRIAREGSQIENKLDHTGMYVSKSGGNVLRATADGVEAIDITVKNYLVVGNHARFEDYKNTSSRTRTACFYLEGGT